MRVVVQFSKRQELQALPILLRHSPGMILRDLTYVITLEAARALRDAGVGMKVLSSEVNHPPMNGAESGKRL